MKIITQAKTLLYGSVAGLTLMVLAANPTLANSHNQILTPEQASSASNELKPSQQQVSQRTAPRNQTTQQTNQMGCACCKSMMSNMPDMMNNMPGIMNKTPGMMNSMPDTMGGQNRQSR